MTTMAPTCRPTGSEQGASSTSNPLRTWTRWSAHLVRIDAKGSAGVARGLLADRADQVRDRVAQERPRWPAPHLPDRGMNADVVALDSRRIQSVTTGSCRDSSWR